MAAFYLVDWFHDSDNYDDVYARHGCVEALDARDARRVAEQHKRTGEVVATIERTDATMAAFLRKHDMAYCHRSARVRKAAR